jgi:hypothetical protein
MELTRILDTLKDADGNPAVGTLSIESPAFIAADGTAVAAGKITITIAVDDPGTPLVDEAGTVDIWLAPTEDSVQNIAAGGEARYTVRYKLTNLGRYPETWAVPRTGGPYKISEVRGF